MHTEQRRKGYPQKLLLRTIRKIGHDTGGSIEENPHHNNTLLLECGGIEQARHWEELYIYLTGLSYPIYFEALESGNLFPRVKYSQIYFGIQSSM